MLSLLAAAPAPLLAQAARAELTGQVTGADGAALMGAQITVRALRTNDARVVVSGDNGFYTLPALPPGGYEATVELNGFKRFVQHAVTLATGERVRLDVALAVGGLEETVDVTGEPSTLRSESASLGQVVPNAEIVGLPLNGRTFITLAALAPGVALPPESQLPRINGGRPRTNEYLFDGISVLQPEPGQVAYFPNIDAIQEFKIETNTPPAEFGRFNGGVGQPDHEVGHEHAPRQRLRVLPPRVAERAQFLRADGRGKPEFRRNQFGGVVGGPIAGIARSSLPTIRPAAEHRSHRDFDRAHDAPAAGHLHRSHRRPRPGRSTIRRRRAPAAAHAHARSPTTRFPRPHRSGRARTALAVSAADIAAGPPTTINAASGERRSESVDARIDHRLPRIATRCSPA